MTHIHTYTYAQLVEAIKYAPDHALSSYADEYMDCDRDDHDYIWDVLQVAVLDMHGPVQLCPSTSPNGEKNKYMVGSNIIAALVMTEEGLVVKSFMTPNVRQRKWMNNN